MTTVTIGTGVESISFGAFSGCNNLKNVEYGGSEEGWANITTGTNNTALENAAINYNSPVYAENAAANRISITKTDNTDEWTFVTQVDRQTLSTNYVYVGIYNGEGKMLTMERTELGSDGTANIDITKVDGAAYAKIFAWYNCQPIAPEEGIDL